MQNVTSELEPEKEGSQGPGLHKPEAEPGPGRPLYKAPCGSARLGGRGSATCSCPWVDSAVEEARAALVVVTLRDSLWR